MERGRERVVVVVVGGGGQLLHFAPVPFLCCFLGVGVRGRTMGRKMVPNQPLNGNTVGGSGSFKARPGHIVLPDRWRRMEFAGGCQKVSILCERLDPLFTALYRAQAPFVLLLLSPLAGPFFTSLRRIRARPSLPSQPPPHPYAPKRGRRVGARDSLPPPSLASLLTPPLSKRSIK